MTNSHTPRRGKPQPGPQPSRSTPGEAVLGHKGKGKGKGEGEGRERQTARRGTRRTEPEIAAALRQHVAHVQQAVAQQGWTTQPVLADIPYCYTVGLSLRSLDEATTGEVLLSGIDPDRACAVLSRVARLVLDGVLRPDESQAFGEIFQGVPARFRALSDRHASAALRLADVLLEADAGAAGSKGATGWQLLWPDAQGRFPGEPGCDPTAERLQELDAVLAAELQG